MFDMKADVKRWNKRWKREEETPLVVYDRGADSHPSNRWGQCRLANVGGYLATIGHHDDYRLVRVVTDPAALDAIKRAQREVERAHRNWNAMLGEAFIGGMPVTRELAEAAEVR
jgi:hypothetical protein